MAADAPGPPDDAERRRLTVRALARVEGEGRLDVTVRSGAVEHARLDIYEPPRFFEAFLRGRDFREPPDITSRICGICPVAYQVSACNALEQACGAIVDPRVRALRRLLYCGEWIASHTLHIYFLHAPDFLGVADSIELARRDRAAVERGLALKKAGNAILETIGGRPIHPVDVRVGGFYRAPTRDELAPLARTLRRALDHALDTVRWVAGFDFPDVHLDPVLAALHDDAGYAIEDGVVRTSAGDRFPAAEFGDHVRERQVPESTALHARLDGAPYLTGPLARYSLNSGQLTGAARDAASAAGLGRECRNPFRSIVVRSVEVTFAIEEALRIIDGYERPDPPCAPVTARAATGHGVSEAPRGLLYHRYELAADGTIRSADIVPPTAQNQDVIEADLTARIGEHLGLSDQELTALCERIIRNHDPCISCATHFLDLRCRVGDRAGQCRRRTRQRVPADDGFGPAVARALRARIPVTIPVTTVTDTADLLDVWAGARLAIVVDLVVPALLPPGRVRRWTLDDTPGPLDTHGVDVAAALALARVLGTAPKRVIVYATSSDDVGFGVHLSAAVRRAVEVTVAPSQRK
ncbi:hydrogenase maturation protease [Rhodococcus hoagii]|nr:hydrogenase maturation protease [Prescottella equi]